jgi:hypothetical protein
VLNVNIEAILLLHWQQRILTGSTSNYINQYILNSNSDIKEEIEVTGAVRQLYLTSSFAAFIHHTLKTYSKGVLSKVKRLK